MTRSSQAIRVGIWQLPADRQNKLRDALAGEPGVQVERSAPLASMRHEARERVTASPPITDVDASLPTETRSDDEDQRLLRFFGGAERKQDFTNQVLAASTSILSHLYALRNLQEFFPREREVLLAENERSQLHALVQDHSTAISTNLEALERQLAPLDSGFKIVPNILPAATATNWQEASLAALETTKAIDHLLRTLLTTNQTPANLDFALPAIDHNFSLLRAQLNALSSTLY